MKQQQCFFFREKGGCAIHNCPFKHSPPVQAGPCNHSGTLTRWVTRPGKGLSFGFISLQDGNNLFCPERALDYLASSLRLPCIVTVQTIEAPSGRGKSFVASKVQMAVVVD